MAIKTLTIHVYLDTDNKCGHIRDELNEQLADKNSDLSKALEKYGYLAAEGGGQKPRFGEATLGQRPAYVNGTIERQMAEVRGDKHGT